MQQVAASAIAQAIFKSASLTFKMETPVRRTLFQEFDSKSARNVGFPPVFAITAANLIVRQAGKGIAAQSNRSVPSRNRSECAFEAIFPNR
jgi:hypothetical protein